MSSLFDKLNLRAGERRLVIGVALVVFIILNFWLVWPQYGEWGREQQRTKDAQAKYNRFKAEVDKTAGYSAELKQLEDQGSQVPTESMANELTKKVQSLANLYGVFYDSLTPGRGETAGRTNAFFEEKTLGMAFNSGEKELVDFLFNLCNDSLMIRAKSMNLSPDPATRQKLKGNLTLVASFQRKTPLKAPASTPAQPPAKTTAAAAKTTNSPPKTAPAPKSTNTAARTVPSEKKK